MTSSMILLLFCLLNVSSLGFGQEEEDLKFPEDFLLGFATASYQIEGAWNEDGKGENIWDRLTHTRPEMIADRSNGDIAADSYHKYKEDVQLLKNLQAQVYRFSLSWSRILPTGESNMINQPGVDYYNNLINELIANGIKPMVTLFHWDLPQPLQDIGGWPNPLLADYFEDYCRVAFKLFGDRVKHWITFNEPFEATENGYSNDVRAPALNLHGTGGYLATHTVLLAHAKCYHLYNETFRKDQQGLVGITLSGGWNQPKTNSSQDIKAADDANQFELGWYAHPIFSSEGDYPAVMRRNIDTNSQNEGRQRSRLPVFTPDQVQYIKGTYDFFGINHYTSYVCRYGDNNLGANPSLDRDKNVIKEYDPSWESSNSGWLKSNPEGFRSLLNWIKNEFNNPVVFVTENGWSTGTELEDDRRIRYHNDYMREMLKSVYEDGVQVKLYTAWSILDNFEWRAGYTERFGIHLVDFSSSSRTRTPKKSAKYFQEVYKNRLVPANIIMNKFV